MNGGGVETYKFTEAINSTDSPAIIHEARVMQASNAGNRNPLTSQGEWENREGKSSPREMPDKHPKCCQGHFSVHQYFTAYGPKPSLSWVCTAENNTTACQHIDWSSTFWYWLLAGSEPATHSKPPAWSHGDGLSLVRCKCTENGRIICGQDWAGSKLWHHSASDPEGVAQWGMTDQSGGMTRAQMLERSHVLLWDLCMILCQCALEYTS